MQHWKRQHCMIMYTDCAQQPNSVEILKFPFEAGRDTIIIFCTLCVIHKVDYFFSCFYFRSTLYVAIVLVVVIVFVFVNFSISLAICRGRMGRDQCNILQSSMEIAFINRLRQLLGTRQKRYFFGYFLTTDWKIKNGKITEPTPIF